MAIVYCYTNLVNGKKYIGQTLNPSQRYKSHKSVHLNEKDPEYDSVFHRALRKYGWENFKYEVLIEDDNIDLINNLEIFYIDFYDTQIPNGYNVLPGGKNCSRSLSDETKEKLRWSHGRLTKEEVIFIRLAYADGKSPKQIYQENFQERMVYSSFMNIWSGNRYATVMPEVIEKGRHTKLNKQQVREIKIALKNNESYRSIAKRYNVTKGAIESIYQGKTWKDVQI